MIKFLKRSDKLLLVYKLGGYYPVEWVDAELRDNGEVTLNKIFTFTKKDVWTEPDSIIEAGLNRYFIFGNLDGQYYKINKDILGLKHDLLISIDVDFKKTTFVAERNISIFSKINELVSEQIIVGGIRENSIPIDEFNLLIKIFPTTTELNLYSRSRIYRIIKDYLNIPSDAEKKLNQHLQRKEFLSKESPKKILGFELEKFNYMYEELSSMLDRTMEYSEKAWQTQILELVRFIFPKYIAVLENVHIKDFYSNPGTSTNRYIDLMLVEANGNIDIIEIKKPFEKALVSSTQYRDSHTPKKELSGSVMQAEKYLFHLNKWGHAGEKEIYTKHKEEIPTGMELKITNPKAMILIGRDNDFEGQQRFDFEIIRRKYANILDIMTYDDLLRRIKNIIEMMQRIQPQNNSN